MLTGTVLPDASGSRLHRETLHAGDMREVLVLEPELPSKGPRLRPWMLEVNMLCRSALLPAGYLMDGMCVQAVLVGQVLKARQIAADVRLPLLLCVQRIKDSAFRGSRTQLSLPCASARASAGASAGGSRMQQLSALSV